MELLGHVALLDGRAVDEVDAGKDHGDQPHSAQRHRAGNAGDQDARIDRVADQVVGAERHDSVTGAVGPERPTFVQIVTSIRDAPRSRARIVHVPGPTVPALARLLGLAPRDVLLTGEEYQAIPAGLADTDRPATAPTALSSWLAGHTCELGLHYANELHRHFHSSPPAPPIRDTPDRSDPARGVAKRT